MDTHLKTCVDHFNKYIFRNKNDACIFMQTYYPKKVYRVYTCPKYTHFHIKSHTTRRRTGQQRNEQRKRAAARKLENEE